MKWFGSSWGAPVCEDTEHVEVPDVSCACCELEFDEQDRGVTLPFSGGPGDPPELSYHHGCFMWLLGVTCVHVLVHGKSLCGTVGMPDWPAGHSWKYIQAWREATCPGCRRAAHVMNNEVA